MLLLERYQVLLLYQSIDVDGHAVVARLCVSCGDIGVLIRFVPIGADSSEQDVRRRVVRQRRTASWPMRPGLVEPSKPVSIFFPRRASCTRNQVASMESVW